MSILLINPILTRLNSPGAAELDTFALAAAIDRLGERAVLVQVRAPGQPAEAVQAFCAAHVPESVVIETPPLDPPRLHPRRLTDLAHLDGAGWIYSSPDCARLLTDALDRHRPDQVIAMMSFAWGAARVARRTGAHTVIRSQNDEASHLLQENGVTPANVIRFIGKRAVERRVARIPDAVAAITPAESAHYRGLNPDAHVVTLPLLTLPGLLRPVRIPSERTPLHVFFMGSSYNVPHNRAALRFLVEEVVPLAENQFPGAFIFHILGSKAPSEMTARAAPHLIFEGYVADLDDFLDGMDIAVVPSLGGAGMQQKAFEPLCRAFPVVTHARVLAGYAFVPGEDLLTADDAQGFVGALGRLRDAGERRAFSARAAARAAALFSQRTIDDAVYTVLFPMILDDTRAPS